MRKNGKQEEWRNCQSHFEFLGFNIPFLCMPLNLPPPPYLLSVDASWMSVYCNSGFPALTEVLKVKSLTVSSF